MIIEKTITDNTRCDVNAKDFVSENELTVTITLNEYRSLIKESIENKKRKEHEDWLQQYNRANKAEARAKELEQEISGLYKDINDMRRATGVEEKEVKGKEND